MEITCGNGGTVRPPDGKLLVLGRSRIFGHRNQLTSALCAQFELYIYGSGAFVTGE